METITCTTVLTLDTSRLHSRQLSRPFHSAYVVLPKNCCRIVLWLLCQPRRLKQRGADGTHTPVRQNEVHPKAGRWQLGRQPS